ncbi:uncharacterized protein J8A68_004897 [[Candida] subhashii]|uniref:Uncharacterized protein n=1 Tax=[Candida] subhashii TaxID=561895 RepID=A0A8J5QJJ7_9ASCO|nr:uncharacterized protein J8A68_004897 [[Candida] subhashii]KAG7661628.1 hypothetical protein J8A68_004897 [[Candida] subhashii]
MLNGHTMVTTTTIVTPQAAATVEKRQEIINNLINLAKQEQQNGNTAITSDKLNKLSTLLNSQSTTTTQTSSNKKRSQVYNKFNKLPQVPDKPKYPPLFSKFDLVKATTHSTNPRRRRDSNNSSVSASSEDPNRPIRNSNNNYYRNQGEKLTFKKFENMVVTALENVANIMDNLHLLSHFPMFPKFLSRLLKQTNKLWVIILIFLVRKTISQLLNVIRKINKVRIEMDLLNRQAKKNSTAMNEDIEKKYNKVLKDLKFDKVMLIIELIGNFLDLGFNLIELYQVILPDWTMSILNFASMAMTVYRMNKDDEYVDDDITEDLI